MVRSNYSYNFGKLLLNKEKEGIYLRQSISLTSVLLLLSEYRKVTAQIRVIMTRVAHITREPHEELRKRSMAIK